MTDFGVIQNGSTKEIHHSGYVCPNLSGDGESSKTSELLRSSDSGRNIAKKNETSGGKFICLCPDGNLTEISADF